MTVATQRWGLAVPVLVLVVAVVGTVLARRMAEATPELASGTTRCAPSP
jgi:hypothetical protein